MRVVFPAPVDPTTPTVSPARSSKFKPVKTGSRPEYEKSTFSKTTDEDSMAESSGVKSPCATSVGEVKTSNTLVEEAMARW
jgi:hypothetical protein